MFHSLPVANVAPRRDERRRQRRDFNMCFSWPVIDSCLKNLNGERTTDAAKLDNTHLVFRRERKQREVPPDLKILIARQKHHKRLINCTACAADLLVIGDR